MRILLVFLVACSSSPTVKSPSNTQAGTPAVDSGPIGTRGPIVIEASDPDGRWVVACQAREDTDGDGEVAIHLGLHGDTYGDAMTPFVIIGRGDGEPIDAFVDQTTDGNWIAAIAGGALVVIDGRTGQRTTIADADLRDDSYPTLGPRVAAFAGPDRLVFMRHRAGGDAVVIRELPGGRETEAAVPGAVWRIEPDAAGTWIRVLTVRKDSDGSGALDWPTQHTSLSSRGCRGPISSYGTYGAAGDEPDMLWVALDGAQVVDDASVVAVAGAGLVRITADKALTIGDEVVLPAGCDPIVRAASAEPPRVLVGCGATAAGKTRLMLVGVKVKQELGIDVDRDDRVRSIAPGDRLACLDRELCIDVTTGAIRRGELVYVDGDRLLIQKAGAYVVVDGGGAETVLPAIEGYPSATAGPVIAIGKTVIDLSAAAIRGAVDGEIAAVDRSGRALVTTAVSARTPGPDLPGGPARWISPK